MKLYEILEEEARKMGFPESTIEEATKYADAVAGQGEDAKKVIENIPDKDVEAIRAYARYILANRRDPEIRQYVNEQTQQTIEKN